MSHFLENGFTPLNEFSELFHPKETGDMICNSLTNVQLLSADSKMQRRLFSHPRTN
jgi:hypothetical protein